MLCGGLEGEVGKENAGGKKENQCYLSKSEQNKEKYLS